MQDVPARRIGLIAGYGHFPLELAQALAEAGFEVHTVAAKEETSKEIEALTASTCWLHVGQIGGMIKAFKKAGVEQVVMAGKIRKLHLFRNFRPDLTAMKGLLRLKDRRDDSILNTIADLLAEEGLTLIEQTLYAGPMLAGEGIIAGPAAGKKRLPDISFGFSQAKVIAGLDIGQTIVVQEQAVLAVEAIEGTDEAIRRGGALGSGKAAVIKVAKPNQDLRFDVPAVGPDTLDVMRASGCNLLAVEAGKTLIIDRCRFIELADQYGISVYGYRDE
ncbi:LpxI family protein [Mariprofundus erugo]|uniref:LpxI family protein n=1 Tax=Mariprofundus erugo TaxID=2528639 RepID=A0A5R9GT62_9PROT|nr:UDP-2,3-diacylglucosamine diphosphatase LpxI [Mariprofundus erugo]TLS67272.1 LpxI family protein [Mariprofundus erugo]TLS76526.1 LpxI family protein [Mariprofundus erugo]